MNANAMIRVLVRSQGPGAEHFRTLVSLSCQDVGPLSQELVLASTDPEAHQSPEARLLYKALGFPNVEIVDARNLSAHQAVNQTAEGGQAEFLALVPEGARLHPRFLSRCLETLRAPAARATYCGHTAGAADGQPAARRRFFRPEQLVRLNTVGPAAVVRRSAWEELHGLRSGLLLAQWDFWLRLVLSGGEIIQTPEFLASCPPLAKLEPVHDGLAKAMLVVSTPGAFEPDVCRWAMAILRRDPWARPFEPGQIPGPRDVAAMFAGFPPVLRPGSAAWNARPRRMVKATG